MYIQNDGEATEIAVYTYSGIAVTLRDIKEEAKIIDAVRATASKLVSERGGLEFSVRSHEIHWFTIEGPVLSADQMAKFSKGDLSFFFVGQVMTKAAKKPLEICGFVIGNNTRAILGCPSFVTEAK